MFSGACAELPRCPTTNREVKGQRSKVKANKRTGVAPRNAGPRLVQPNAVAIPYPLSSYPLTPNP